MATDATTVVLGLLATVLLILANALFVFHEFAFVTIKPAQIRRLAEGKSAVSSLVARGVHHLDHYIAVDQLGITATSIAVGWIGQPVVAALLAGALSTLGFAVAGVAAALAFALITGAQMVVGELVPKTVALRHPERTASLVALPVEVVARIAHPVVWALNGLGRQAARLFGATPQAESTAHVLPADELAAAIEASARAGTLAAEPRTIVRALRFSDLRARDVMVPRRDIVAIEAGMSTEEALALARGARYTRYPVYRGSEENVIGLLNIKDLVQCLPGDPCHVGIGDWRRLIRPIPFLPEVAEIESLLALFRREKQHMVLLVDEFGSTAGITTVADVLDQLLGEVEDVRPRGDGTFVIRGSADVGEVESALSISLGKDDSGYETIGGLVMARLGRIPIVGDKVQAGERELMVQAMEGRRVTQVLIGTQREPDASS